MASWHLRADTLRVLHAHLGIFNSCAEKKNHRNIYGFFFSFSVSFCGGSKTDHSGIVKMVLEKRF